MTLEALKLRNKELEKYYRMAIKDFVDYINYNKTSDYSVLAKQWLKICLSISTELYRFVLYHSVTGKILESLIDNDYHSCFNKLKKFTNNNTVYSDSWYLLVIPADEVVLNAIYENKDLNESVLDIFNFNGFAEDSLNESYVSLNQMSTFRSTSFENNTHNFGECINVLSPSIKLLDNKVIEKVLIIRDRRLNKEGDRDRTRHHIVLYIPDSFDDYDLTNRDFDYLLNLNDNALTSSLMKIWDLEPEYVVYAGYVEIEPNDTVYEPTYDERDIQKKLYDVIRKGYNRLKGYQKGYFKLEISKIL